MGEAVYARLLELTGDLIAVGENVVVDAAFLSSANRATFQAFARKQGCECVVVQCDAQPDVLRQRVVLRLASGDDPSEATLAVLDRQLESFDLPGPDEQTIRVCTDQDVDIQHIITQLNAPTAPPTDDQQPRIMP